ncbi:unnamed protein product [Mytilus edulis]|uniref:Uncharacterized protein n=1 Tax=Mytilus edulis TaxID=6550 RepID=A0A8S3TQC1_MYTED|nr:unnamed protein product [Mytilus edulis]
MKTLNDTQNVRVSWTVQHLQAGFYMALECLPEIELVIVTKLTKYLYQMKNENAGFSFYIILSGSASLILAFIIVFTAYGIRRCLRRKIQINHSSTQTYKIEASQYDEIDENQIIHVHDVETAASDEIHVTDIDSDYEQPDNSVIRQRSNSDQRNLPSGSSSESSKTTLMKMTRLQRFDLNFI